MKSNAKQRKQDREKRELWKNIELVYRNAKKAIASLLKKNKRYHLYEDKDGWDNSVQPISGHVNEEMVPGEIIAWMYENDVNPRSIKSPYIYSDDEIGYYRKNRDLLKIEDWKKSIEFYKEQIRKYKKRISDAEMKSGEREDA